MTWSLCNSTHNFKWSDLWSVRPGETNLFYWPERNTDQHKHMTFRIQSVVADPPPRFPRSPWRFPLLIRTAQLKRQQQVFLQKVWLPPPESMWWRKPSDITTQSSQTPQDTEAPAPQTTEEHLSAKTQIRHQCVINITTSDVWRLQQIPDRIKKWAVYLKCCLSLWVIVYLGHYCSIFMHRSHGGDWAICYWDCMINISSV